MAKSLDPAFNMICQRQSNWCWAAVSAAVKGYVEQNLVTQCAVATAVLPGDLRCCAAPDSCDIRFSLTEALERVDTLLLPLDKQVTFDVIQDQIDRNKPVCARIQWVDRNGDPDGAHFVVIVGYTTDEQTVPTLLVQDPAGGPVPEESEIAASNAHEVPFEEFRSRYKMNGKWTHTYLVK